MKFSVVTLAFKQRDFLRQAIDSVLTQDYPDIEYIVVEPGSNDGSRELIEEYGDRIAHKIFEPDRGAADGLNKGFAKATGEIFGFLNADDLLLPHAIRTVAEFFERNPGLDMVMGDGFITDHLGKPVRHVKATPFSISRYLVGGSNWMQQSTFFRRSAFEAVGGFNEENRSCWDGELFVSMVANGAKVGIIHRDLSMFRVHPASITGSGRALQIYHEDSERVFRRLRGRGYRTSDRLLGYFYRIERLVRDPSELFHAVRYRLQGRPQ